MGTSGEIPRTCPFEDVGGPFFLDPHGKRADDLKDDCALWFHVITSYSIHYTKLYDKQVFDDHGNYLLARFEDGATLFHTMAEAGIILRDFGSKPMLANSVRITIGDEAEMAAVRAVLAKL